MKNFIVGIMICFVLIIGGLAALSVIDVNAPTQTVTKEIPVPPSGL